MIVAVFDTNILVSSFISKGAPYNAMLSVFDGKVRIATSPDLIREFREVIGRNKFGFSDDLIEQMTLMIMDLSDIVSPKAEVDVVLQDPQDNRVLECALASKADLIVSGDPHLLMIGQYAGIRILNVNEFLETLR